MIFLNIILKYNLTFKENPFRDRIFRVFSSNEDGGMTFDEFLDLHSVFNNQVSIIEEIFEEINSFIQYISTKYLRGRTAIREDMVRKLKLKREVILALKN